MDRPWPEVHLRATPDSAEMLEDWLFSAGAVSVSYRDNLDQAILEPAPGEVRLWEQIELIGLFAQDDSPDQIHDALLLTAAASSMQTPVYTLSMLGDQVWERAWMDAFEPMQFGENLWVCPSHRPVVDESAINIKLDPGLAFGTGTHATTALCLEWLGSLSGRRQALAGKSVLDFGCGSGVLAIAAALMGASSLLAIDIDPQALLATRQNADANQVGDQIETELSAAQHTTDYDLLMANILFQPLMELANDFSSMLRPGGKLLLSGILEEQIEPLRLRYNASFEFESNRVQDGWAMLVASRRTK